MSGQFWAAIGSVLAAIMGAVVGLRNGTKANASGQSNAQLAWVKQAQEEAATARQEAREAKAESAAARVESERAWQQSVLLRRQFDAMQDWVDRVLRARDTYLAEHGDDPARMGDTPVQRVLRAVDGGPSLRSPTEDHPGA